MEEGDRHRKKKQYEAKGKQNETKDVKMRWRVFWEDRAENITHNPHGKSR